MTKRRSTTTSIEDFYALTRHADVAAALKDHEAFSSGPGCDLDMVRSGDEPHEVDHLHGSAGPPTHAQPAQQGFHPTRDPVATRDGHRTRRALPEQGRPGQLRRGAGLLGPLPGRGDHPDGRRARRVPAAGPALDRQGPGARARPDRAERAKHAGQHRLRYVLLRPDAGATAQSSGRHDQPLDRRGDPRRERRDAQARRHRDHRLHLTVWAALAPRRSPSWSAAPWSSSPAIPSSGRCCSTIAA